MTFSSEEVKHLYFTKVSASRQLALQQTYLTLAAAKCLIHVEDVIQTDTGLEIIIRVSLKF